MMGDRQVILDIAGEEKQRLTVPEEIERFHRRAGEVFSDDRALPAEQPAG